MVPVFSASLMCMDFLHVQEQLEILNHNIEFYHVDIIDGHYSKNLSLSPDLVKSFSKVAAKPIEVHLATVYPEDWILPCAKAGASYISVHIETINNQAFRILNLIKDTGCKIGIVLNPATPISYAEPILERADILNIMTVDPGFPGQPFIEGVLNKIRAAVILRDEMGYKYKIQVDGSVNKKTFKRLKEAGADIFVLGSTGLFNLDSDLSVACKIAYEDFYSETNV